MSNKKVTVTYNSQTLLNAVELSNSNVVYNNTTIISDGEYDKTLKCKDKVMATNIAIGSSATLKCAGEYMSSDIAIHSELATQFILVKPSNLTPSATYTGGAITNGYTTPSNCTMTGSNSGINTGTYTATYTPDDGYGWTDGTTSSVTVILTINKATGYVSTAPTNRNATATTYQDVTICNAGSGTGAMYYSKDGSNYSTSIPTQNGGGGNTTIYYYAEASTNYTRSEIGSVSCYLYPDYLCFTANTANSTVAMSVTGTPTLGQNFSYSTDGSTWTTFTPGSTTVTLSSVGSKVYFKGNNPNGVNQSSSIYYMFTMTGSIAASGNIMSLIDNGACTTLTIPNSYCYEEMFEGCTSLIVSNASGTGYTNAWRIPSSGTFTNTYAQEYMFTGCATGSGRSSNAMAGASGNSYTYYTQNTPV